MGTAYNVGLMIGYFAAGCICGLFPLFVAIIKKRAKLGVVLMLACGAVSFIHPIVSIALAVVSGIALCFMRKNA